ncbi:Cys-tRNA(Pro) deacylase [Hugenholtzia roseola]|uniref:Cys-tRNA(Pro) deacylase n=1 Tax=Hugenholtzia roseola TaxID=1002 RepID=UPI000404485D|nr:Cys-tRNA(Pro) deacylase [Hugenholtzia roseola]
MKTNALRLLEQKKIAYQVVEYQYDTENLDVAKIALDNALPLAHIFKTLVTISPTGEIMVALVGGDKQLSKKKLAQQAGHKKIELLPLKDLLPQTGYQRGGCSPLGMKKKFRTFIDKAGLELSQIYVNAGKRGLLFSIAPQTLAELTAAIWAEITEEEAETA